MHDLFIFSELENGNFYLYGALKEFVIEIRIFL